MQFSENNYFTNKELQVVLSYKSEDSDEPVKVEGSVIDWVDGNNITKKKIKKKQKNKKTNETRQIVKTVDAESFF